MFHDVRSAPAPLVPGVNLPQDAEPRLPGCTVKDCMKLHLRYLTLRPFISQDVENSLLDQNISTVYFTGKIPWSMNLPALTQRSGVLWFQRGGWVKAMGRGVVLGIMPDCFSVESRFVSVS